MPPQETITHKKGKRHGIRNAGNTGLLVSRLCFGTMTFGDGRGLFKAIGAVDQAGADLLVKASLDCGINFFDTADNYTEGESEKILGQSLKNLNIARHDVVVGTKVYSRVGPGRNDVGASRGHIMDAVEASLRRLQTDHIDLYQIHGNDAVTPVEETLRALDTLVQQGKVRYIVLLQLAGMENRQSPRHLRIQESGPIRHASTLPTRSPAAISNGKSFPCWYPKRSACSLESACRRLAFRQVQPDEPEAGGFAPH